MSIDDTGAQRLPQPIRLDYCDIPSTGAGQPPPPPPEDPVRKLIWQVGAGVVLIVLTTVVGGAYSLKSSVDALERFSDVHQQYGHTATAAALAQINERLASIETTLDIKHGHDAE